MLVEEINLENSVNTAQKWLAKMDVNETGKVKARRIRSHIRAVKKLRQLEKADRKLCSGFSCAYDRIKSIDAISTALTAVCRTEDNAYIAGAKASELVC